jgi:hypothetical protein
MTPPILEENNCSVLISEYATGHVFKRDLTLFLNGEDESEVFQIFDNFSNAKDFVLSFIKSNPEFECTIYNFKGDWLATYDQNGERRVGTLI